MRSLNFSAGPAALPLSVATQMRDEMLDYHGTGMGVAEMSHRGATFKAIIAQGPLRPPRAEAGSD